MNNIVWFCKSFNNIDSTKIYSLLQARSEVFVVEQQAIYQDIDGIDLDCHHLWGEDQQGDIASYARFYKMDDYIAIGRILTTKKFRGMGLGKLIIQKILKEIKASYPSTPIKMSAQDYLKDFYKELGFKIYSDPYLTDDGILHINMEYNKNE